MNDRDEIEVPAASAKAVHSRPLYLRAGSVYGGVALLCNHCLGFLKGLSGTSAFHNCFWQEPYAARPFRTLDPASDSPCALASGAASSPSSAILEPPSSAASGAIANMSDAYDGDGLRAPVVDEDQAHAFRLELGTFNRENLLASGDVKDHYLRMSHPPPSAQPKPMRRAGGPENAILSGWNSRSQVFRRPSRY